MSSDSEAEPEENTIATDLVVTKYKMAADIINSCMKKLMEMCVAGAKIRDLCEFGDKYMADETAKVFKKEKEMKKGIAFPTCISVNNCICHFSPLKSDPEVTLKDRDMVKIDIGAHVDGFPAVAGHTFVVGASADNKVTGRCADVIVAAHNVAEAMLRLVKPGADNWSITDKIQKIAESFKCKPIEGMLSHQLQKHVIDGQKTIIQNPTENQRREQEKHEFDVHEVYGIDVIISTGEGRGREMNARTTVYKRKDIIYNLKMKASRQFFSEVEKKFNTMPFSLRMFEDEKKARMGVIECVKHDLIESFNVLYERENEFVAQFKYTLLLMPNGPMRITGMPFDPNLYQTEHSIEDEELKALVTSSISRKTQKKKKKKVARIATDSAAGTDAQQPQEGATS